MAKKLTAKEEQSAAKDRTERESAPVSKAKGYEPETPSALALAKVGEAPELKHNNVEAVLEHGEKYQAEKKKHRWG